MPVLVCWVADSSRVRTAPRLCPPPSLSLPFPPRPVACRYYKQPGHPQHELSEKGGRFSKQKNMETWDPKDPKGLNTKQPIRDLTEV